MKKTFRQNSNRSKPKWLIGIFSLALLLTSGWSGLHGSELDQTGTLWAPVIEWSLENRSWSGNPFDLEASATFVHSKSGATRKTPKVYVGATTRNVALTAT